MNKEQILADINIYIDSCDAGVLINLREKLKADIRTENNKKTGKAKPEKLAKAIFKSAPKDAWVANGYSKFQYSYILDDKQWVLDGHRVVGFSEQIDLPIWDEKEKGNWFDVKAIMDRYKNGVPYDYKEIKFPTAQELKAEIKITKAGIRGGKVMYVFDSGLAINAQYLLDFLEGFTDVRLYAGSNKEPIYITANEGIGLLLPIVNKDKPKGYYNI